MLLSRADAQRAWTRCSPPQARADETPRPPTHMRMPRVTTDGAVVETRVRRRAHAEARFPDPRLPVSFSLHPHAPLDLLAAEAVHGASVCDRRSEGRGQSSLCADGVCLCRRARRLEKMIMEGGRGGGRVPLPHSAFAGLSSAPCARPRDPPHQRAPSPAKHAWAANAPAGPRRAAAAPRAPPPRPPPPGRRPSSRPRPSSTRWRARPRPGPPGLGPRRCRPPCAHLAGSYAAISCTRRGI